MLSHTTYLGKIEPFLNIFEILRFNASNIKEQQYFWIVVLFLFLFSLKGYSYQTYGYQMLQFIDVLPHHFEGSCLLLYAGAVEQVHPHLPGDSPDCWHSAAHHQWWSTDTQSCCRDCHWIILHNTSHNRKIKLENFSPSPLFYLQQFDLKTFYLPTKFADYFHFYHNFWSFHKITFLFSVNSATQYIFSELFRNC